MTHRLSRLAACLLAGSALSACAATERLSYVGQPPPLTPIENETALRGADPDGRAQGMRNHLAPQNMARLEALAMEREREPAANSLWRDNARSFFGDPRASQIGDILTVRIDISDRAQVSNQTNRSRTTAEDSDLTNFLGGEAALDSFLGDAVDPSSLTSFGSSSSTQGAGTVNRSETIELSAAAIVVDVLWNGNLLIHGRQEVRINNEVRELLMSGIVRPEDINSDNTISHQQIAEARISYGGRGHITEMQRPPIGQEIYNLLWPF